MLDKVFFSKIIAILVFFNALFSHNFFPAPPPKITFFWWMRPQYIFLLLNLQTKTTIRLKFSILFSLWAPTPNCFFLRWRLHQKYKFGGGANNKILLKRPKTNEIEEVLKPVSLITKILLLKFNFDGGASNKFLCRFLRVCSRILSMSLYCKTL